MGEYIPPNIIPTNSEQSGPVIDIGPTDEAQLHTFTCGSRTIFIASHESNQPEETLPQSIQELSINPLIVNPDIDNYIPQGISNFAEYYERYAHWQNSNDQDFDLVRTLNFAFLFPEANEAAFADTLQMIRGVICSSEYVFDDDGVMWMQLQYLIDGPDGSPLSMLIHFPTDEVQRNFPLEPYINETVDGPITQRLSESIAVFTYDNKQQRNVGVLFTSRPYVFRSQNRHR